MLELLGQTFFQHALIAGSLVAATCSFVGVYVVLKRIAFLAIALAQIASAGVALALLLGLNPLVTALAASLAGAVAFSQIRWRGRAPIEGVLATSYVLAAALGTVFIAKNPVGEARALNVLFGNILSVPVPELAALAVVTVAVALIHLRFRKEFLFVSFDFETAAAHGVKARFWNLLLYLTLGVAIAFAIRSTGVLVTFALLVVPAVGARLLTAGVDAMFATAVGLGTLAVPIGLAAAFTFDLPTGATISLTVAGLFAAALAARALARVVRRPVPAAAASGVVLLLMLPGAEPTLAQARPAEPPAATGAPATGAPATGAPATEAPATEAPATVERRGFPPFLALLPEIRLEGNLIGNYTFRDRRTLETQLGEEVPPPEEREFFVRRNRFNLRSVELGLRSAIDPFARFEAIFEAEQAFGGELEVGLEEGFLTLTPSALPLGLELTVGKFRTHFGEFNDSDPEEFPEVDSPKVITNLFGRDGEGWIDTGAALTRRVGVTDKLVFQPWVAVFNGDNETAFHGGGRGVARKPAWFGRLETFLELGQSTGLEFGVGYAEGRALVNPDVPTSGANLRSQIANAHVELDYRPPTAALYRGFNVLTEFFYTRRERVEEDVLTGAVTTEALSRFGVYTLAELQVTRNWALGGRFDYSQLPDPEDGRPSVSSETAGSFIASYRPSRFLTVRAQYTHTERNFAIDSDEVFLQALFIIGFERPGPF
jgi:zinc transport system permease protein